MYIGWLLCLIPMYTSGSGWIFWTTTLVVRELCSLRWVYNKLECWKFDSGSVDALQGVYICPIQYVLNDRFLKIPAELFN